MKKAFYLISLVSVLFVTLSGPAFALGMGFFGTLEGGSGDDWEIESPNGVSRDDYDSDVGRLGVGFVLDTAVAKDKLFNYRLNAALLGLDIELDNPNITGKGEAELVGLAFDNTFGFGVLRSEKVRLWLGPRVRVGFYVGDTDDFSTSQDDDVAVAEFGVGGAFGANFHVGPTVSLGLETGFMISGYAGEIETRAGNWDIEGSTASLFLNGVVLFRLSGD